MTDISMPLELKSFSLKLGTTLIEASAGTGKTYTIQFIVLDLLLKGVPVQEILVVTFTEAATKELKDRLQGFLAEVNSVLLGEIEPDPDLDVILKRALAESGQELVKERIRLGLFSIDEASVFTIHGFCQRALQENAFSANSSYGMNVCAEPERLIEEIVRDFRRRANFELSDELPDSMNSLRLNDRAKLLTGMLSVEVAPQGPLCQISDRLKAAIETVRTFATESDLIIQELRAQRSVLKATTYKTTFWEHLESEVESFLEAPQLQSKRTAERLSKSKIESSFKKSAVVNTVVHPFFAACDRYLAESKEFEVQCLHVFDCYFIEEFQKRKLSLGQITYDDMILNLDRSLQKSPALCEQLRRHYRAALVDEFQDTDGRQLSIFRQIFGESSDHYFAMIGDPKQSIYSFRKADIRTYLKARDEANYHYTLTTNFRSEANMVAGVNAFFAKSNLYASGDSEEGNPRLFERVDAFAAAGRDRLVFAGGFDPERLFLRGIGGEESSIGEAVEEGLCLVASDIHELIRLAGRKKVAIESSSGGQKKLRSLEAGDIAVLVDTHNEAESVQAYLAAHRVPAVRTQSGNVLETEEAGDFVHFMSACLNPSESSANGLLVSQLFGKTNSDLKGDSPGEQSTLFLSLLQLGRQWKSGQGVGMIWNRFLEEQNVRRRLLGRVGGERTLTNYIHLGELAQELEHREALSPERLLDRFLRWLSGDDWEGSVDQNATLIRLESDRDAVKILTMHSSKGLEFPVVFLPTLWQKAAKIGAGEKVVAVEADPDCYREIVKDAERIRSDQESEIRRIGYVALTRAVHWTIYYTATKYVLPKGRSRHRFGWFDLWLSQERGELPVPRIGFDELCDGLDDAGALEYAIDSVENEHFYHNCSRAISDSYQITSYSSLSRSRLELEKADPSELESGMDELEAVATSELSAGVKECLLFSSFPSGVRTGTCIHEILEIVDFSNSTQWSALIASTVRRHFPELSSSESKGRIEEVLTFLQLLTSVDLDFVGAQSFKFRDLGLSGRLNEMEFYFPVERVDLNALEEVLSIWARRNGLSYSPLRFQRREINGFLTGSVDLFFEADGRFFVLDWKTNSPLPEMEWDYSAYSSAALHHHMLHGRYYLQALIYMVATTAYLKHRMGSRFEWDLHVGGFVYCFVRGLREQSGWLAGCFTEDEVLSASRALGASEQAGKDGKGG